MYSSRTKKPARLTAVACTLMLLLASCGSSGAGSEAASPTEPTTAPETVSQEVGEPEATVGDAAPEPATTQQEPVEGGVSQEQPTDEHSAEESATEEEPDIAAVDTASASPDCQTRASEFGSRGSANPDLDAPIVDASCDGETVVVLTNAVPDYTYVETSPGFPGGREATYTVPVTATIADTTTDVPYIGPIGITLGGIPIFGPTEGTGGDVGSLPGILSACGSHNGPTGFHIHQILTSSETDCLFTPEEVAEGHQLIGYAFDGFPIYTGIDQFSSSWQLTDESLFATDTWAAHSFVEGSGDLDECNGRFDENGDYAYYTTETFPYVIGCFAGEVSGGGSDEGGPDGERPERPEGEGDAGGDRPERPEGDGERPARAEEGQEEEGQ